MENGLKDNIVNKWTPETIAAEAKKYNTKDTFALNASGAVKAARRLGIYELVCIHMKRKIQIRESKKVIWNKENIRLEALKYSSKSEFSAKKGPTVKEAKRLGIYEEVCSHMHTNYKTWTDIELHKEALNYTTKVEFQKTSNSAYTIASTRGIIDKICGHMIETYEEWTYKKVLESASKYTRRVDFQRNIPNAYAAAVRNQWLDNVCAHMPAIFNAWTNQELRQEALKYAYRSDFQYENKSAYLAAQKRDLLREICSHMEYKNGSTQLDNEMYLYYVRIDTLDSSLPPIWKIGITRYEDPLRRFKREISVVKTKITVLKTWYFNKGYAAANAERNVMETYKAYAYMGESPLRETKTTEMFYKNILKLEVENG